MVGGGEGEGPVARRLTFNSGGAAGAGPNTPATRLPCVGDLAG